MPPFKELRYALMTPRSDRFELRTEELHGRRSHTDSERLSDALRRIIGGPWILANGILTAAHAKPFGYLICEEALPRRMEFNLVMQAADGSAYPIFGNLAVVRLHGTSIRSLTDGDLEKIAAQPFLPADRMIPHGDDTQYWGMMRSLRFAEAFGIDIPAHART